VKKKILFVYDSMMTGGTSTALLSLINTIDLNKYEISLLLYTNTGELMGEIPEYVRLLDHACKESKILSSRHRKIIKTVLNGRIFLALKAFLKYKNTPKGNLRHILMHYGMTAQVSLSRVVDEQFDYAIGFMEGWSNEYVASKKINATKKFVWIHPQYKSCYLIPEIDKKTFDKVNGIALISENCLKQFFEFFPEYEKKTYVVPNIMSHELILKKACKEDVAIQKANINFCTVCRCDIQVKGLDRLLKAFYELKKEGLTEGVLWHLIGGGTEFEQFKQDVSSLQMDDTIILYGNKLNPLPYVKQMDIFILASRYEGKPVSVTESQILGLPCLVTNYEAASSQIQHKTNGMIMDNNYESIYETIKTVIKSRELISRWRTNTMLGSYGNEKDIEAFYNLIDSK
jgi:glycosyltransferase involved in cell wall biosynthesis